MKPTGSSKRIENVEPPVLCWFFEKFENPELRFFDSDCFLKTRARCY
jgi:hypothetical protein